MNYQSHTQGGLVKQDVRGPLPHTRGHERLPSTMRRKSYPMMYLRYIHDRHKSVDNTGSGSTEKVSYRHALRILDVLNKEYSSLTIHVQYVDLKETTGSTLPSLGMILRITRDPKRPSWNLDTGALRQGPLASRKLNEKRDRRQLRGPSLGYRAFRYAGKPTKWFSITQ